MATRWVTTVCCVVISALLAIATVSVVNLDDAFITLAYSQNLADSGGLFFNVEDGAVDGFTSPLDMVLKALLLALGVSGLVALRVATHLQLAAAVILTEREVKAKTGFAVATLVAIASSPELADAGASLLEGPLFVALGIAAVAWFRVDREPSVRWMLVLCLLPLCRPEGLVVVVVSVGCYVLGQRENWRGATTKLLPVGGFLLVYYLLRILYFGYWAPNTYYAKLSASRWDEVKHGISFLVGYARSGVSPLVKLVAILLAPLLLLVSWRDQPHRWRMALCVATSLLLVAGVVYAGGDSYSRSSRFMALPVALLLVGLANAYSNVGARLRVVVGAVMAAVLVSHFYSAVTLPWSDAKANLTDPSISGVRVSCAESAAHALARSHPNASIGQTDFQALKYFIPHHRVIDLHGLNNKRIAHQSRSWPVRWGKFEQQEAIVEYPDIYLMGYTLLDGRPWSHYAGAELLANHELVYEFTGMKEAAPTADEAKILSERYNPASMRICGLHFNYLVSRYYSSQ